MKILILTKDELLLLHTTLRICADEEPQEHTDPKKSKKYWLDVWDSINKKISKALADSGAW